MIELTSSCQVTKKICSRMSSNTVIVLLKFRDSFKYSFYYSGKHFAIVMGQAIYWEH